MATAAPASAAGLLFDQQLTENVSYCTDDASTKAMIHDKASGKITGVASILRYRVWFRCNRSGYTWYIQRYRHQGNWLYLDSRDKEIEGPKGRVWSRRDAINAIAGLFGGDLDKADMFLFEAVGTE